MFKYIVGFAALVVAGCAAFFSVQGLATLYAGQFIAVCVMAGGLEFGKLVAASYLHRYWKETSFLLRTYLIIAVIALMGITSLGIFGFLTSAFQQSHVKIEIVDTQRESLESKKETIQNEVSSLTKRIDVLNQSRLAQEKRLPNLTRKASEPIYQDIKKSSEEISISQERIKIISDEIKNIDSELLLLKKEESKSTDIGTLKFVSQLFNKDISTIVKWFTIIIVLVFDPLAVSLVLAYNNIVTKKPNKTISQETITEEEVSEETTTEETLNRVSTPYKVKYQDK
jgi:hypothetical protein